MKLSIEDLKDLVEFTAQKTGFSARLIEKDYYCSLLLQAIYNHDELKNTFVFKGGTLLSKGFTNFFRLSEDLDFSAINRVCKTRGERKIFADSMRKHLFKILSELKFTIIGDIKGFNESQQYNGVFQYKSYLGIPDTIKFDLGLRSDLFRKPEIVPLNTLLLDPMKNKSAFPKIHALALSIEETYAEKARAALSRHDPAIRDFFDLWMAKNLGILPNTDEYFDLVDSKIKSDPYAKAEMSDSKKAALKDQIAHELNSVLKRETAQAFNFEDSWKIALHIFNSIPG